MTEDRCTEMRLLLQAELDGELDTAGATALVAHVADCAGCAEERRKMANLSARLRAELPYHAAPPALRQAIEARLAATTPRPAAPVPGWRARLRAVAGAWRPSLAFGAGAFGAGGLAAAALVLLLVLPGGGNFPDQIVSDHIRALQPGHLTDVISTDQHTVKPWFDGRLDFSPPVQDFAAEGFPLVGGRLDYLAGHPAAVLVYRRAKHVIDLYVWPAGRSAPSGPAAGTRNGYNFIRWTQDGMAFWAVSDVAAPALQDFVRLWKTGGAGAQAEPK